MAFFKLPQYRVFDYKPRIYDERKDRLEQRRRELGLLNDGKQSDVDTSEIGKLVRSGAMRQNHDKWEQRVRKEKQQARNRLIIIILLLFAFFYVMMEGFGPAIVQGFLGK